MRDLCFGVRIVAGGCVLAKAIMLVLTVAFWMCYSMCVFWTCRGDGSRFGDGYTDGVADEQNEKSQTKELERERERRGGGRGRVRERGGG